MAYKVQLGPRFPPNLGKQVDITQIIEDGAGCYPWREVFAWLPVTTISGKRIWWRKVWKKRVWAVWGASFHYEPVILYGDSLDLLCDLYIDNIQC